jgi:hypothetical protein
MKEMKRPVEEIAKLTNIPKEKIMELWKTLKKNSVLILVIEPQINAKFSIIYLI